MNKPPRPPQIALAPMFGKEIPHSYQAEVSFLGAVFIDPAMLSDLRRIVKPEDFYDERHAAIYEALLSVYDRDRNIDQVLLFDELAKAPGYNREEGAAHLIEIVESTPSAAGAPAYAKILKEKSRLRQLVRLCGELCHAAYTEPDSAEATITAGFERIAALTRIGVERRGVPLADAGRMVIDALDAGRPAYLRTGLTDFDLIAGGVPRSGVWTIFGTPGSGKSTAALQAAVNLARGLEETDAHPAQPPTVVRYYSVEQGPMRAAATVLSQASGLGVHAMLNKGEATENEKDAIADAWATTRGNFEFLPDSMDPNQLFAECAALASKHEHGVLVVDYLQDIPPFGIFQELTPRITEAMRVLARIARELNWLVIVVSQLDKAAGKLNQSPKLTDGLGSSAIEQRSDLISYVWRPHQREIPPPTEEDQFGIDRGYEAWKARQSRILMGIIKNKFGCVGVNQMQFIPRAMRFVTPDPAVLGHWKVIQE